MIYDLDRCSLSRLADRRHVAHSVFDRPWPNS